MALLNRPMTAEEAKTLLNVNFVPLGTFFKLVSEPHYQTVRYRGALNRVDYERPDTFYGLGPESPSDCVWMVPGILPTEGVPSR